MLSYIFLNNIYFEYYFDFLMLELFILNIFFFFLLEKNLFYNLFYLFLLFFIFGLFILLFHLDLSAAFFWVAEITVIFVFILCLLQLNIFSIINPNMFYSTLNYLYLFFFFFFLNYYFFKTTPSYFYYYFEISDFYKYYYDYLNDLSSTDLYGFFLMFYTINAVEFLLLMFLILIITFILIKFMSIILLVTNTNKNLILKDFKFSKTFFNFFFKRNQNLFNQFNKKSSFKFFFKKK